MGYVKTTVITTYDDSSDYSTPGAPTRSVSYESSAVTKFLGPFTISATTGGVTLEMGMLTTCAGLTVKNKDTTNFITLAYDTTAASATTLKVLAGQVIHLVSIDPATDLTLTADTATCSVEVTAYGT